MRRFIETTYFRCLSNGFTEKDIELDEAYDEFVHYLVTFCKNEQDPILLSLTLSYTKSEFQSLKQRLMALQGDEFRFLFIDKSLAMIDSAIHVVDLRINNPTILGLTQAKKIQKFPLYLSDSEDFEKWMKRLFKKLNEIGKDIKSLVITNEVLYNIEKSSTKRTQKVTTDVLMTLLQKLGISSASDDKAKMARLISYLTAFSEEKIRQRLSNADELTSYHREELEIVNKIFAELNCDISIKYNNKR
ncbi:MAG: hypothetical protein ABFC28_09735 [Rikenellaceae bacterium]